MKIHERSFEESDDDAACSWELVSNSNDAEAAPATSSATRGSIDNDDDDDDENQVTDRQLKRYRCLFDCDTLGKVAQNAGVKHSVHELTLRRDLIQSNDFVFNKALPYDLAVTNQRSSGRCWMFATLNLLRYHAAETLNVSDIEFSEAFLFFYDKLEKANAFLENIIATSSRDMDDRLIQMLISDPAEDGNDWKQAVSLIRKYGLVPKWAYPESYTSSSSDNMNNVLYDLLLSTANDIRAGKADDTSDARTIKNKCLQDVYRILSIHLGSPPTEFDWEYRDKDGTLHSYGVTTPLEFVKQAIDGEKVPFETYVSLLHDPRHDYYQPYVWECSQTVVGGLDVVFLNVPIEEMKKVNRAILEDGRPVFFACNVGNEFANTPGLWDLNLYETNKFYGIKGYGMNKKDRLLYGYPMGTHAMLMTGVDVRDDDDTPRRWKVENSWGVEGGHDGYYTMNDNWYDEFVFEIIAPPQYLTDEMKKGLQKEPTVLPGWDSACARRRSHKS